MFGSFASFSRSCAVQCTNGNSFSWLLSNEKCALKEVIGWAITPFALFNFSPLTITSHVELEPKKKRRKKRKKKTTSPSKYVIY